MGIVWDTDKGGVCPLCGRRLDACPCRRSASDKGDGVARLRIERAGRKGKTVTVIDGLRAEGLKALVKSLKKRCGTGATIKDGCVELQGDHRAKVREELKKREIQVKG